MKAEDLASPGEWPVKFSTSFTVLQTLEFGFTTEIITAKGDNSQTPIQERQLFFSSRRMQATQALVYLRWTSGKQRNRTSIGQAENHYGAGELGNGNGKQH